ncbi:unnamed protein product [Anisakis simplex]|uniref:BTB domain-containing protein n=1 Tax=Anisakis simplex TaxID=6269 RepID=A0A0M3JSN7_ANISI|nr:unnamed protein product [Anisakis simplex]
MPIHESTGYHYVEDDTEEQFVFEEQPQSSNYFVRSHQLPNDYSRQEVIYQQQQQKYKQQQQFAASHHDYVVGAPSMSSYNRRHQRVYEIPSDDVDEISVYEDNTTPSSSNVNINNTAEYSDQLEGTVHAAVHVQQSQLYHLPNHLQPQQQHQQQSQFQETPRVVSNESNRVIIDANSFRFILGAEGMT